MSTHTWVASTLHAGVVWASIIASTPEPVSQHRTQKKKIWTTGSVRRGCTWTEPFNNWVRSANTNTELLGWIQVELAGLVRNCLLQVETLYHRVEDCMWCSKLHGPHLGSPLISAPFSHSYPPMCWRHAHFYAHPIFSHRLFESQKKKNHLRPIDN